MTKGTDTARAFDGRAFALLSPGAPQGAGPVPLEERDDGPGGRSHDSFVLVDGLYASETKERAAAKRAVQRRGRIRRLLVELELRDALVVDARDWLNATALRRGDRRQLEELTDLYEAGIDIVRIDGVGGEVDLVFTEALGRSVLVVSQSIVPFRLAERLRPADLVIALLAAIVVEGALKWVVDPLVHLGVPVWLVLLVVAGVFLFRKALATARDGIERARRELIEEVAETVDRQRERDRETRKPRRRA